MATVPGCTVFTFSAGREMRRVFGVVRVAALLTRSASAPAEVDWRMGCPPTYPPTCNNPYAHRPTHMLAPTTSSGIVRIRFLKASSVTHLVSFIAQVLKNRKGLSQLEVEDEVTSDLARATGYAEAAAAASSRLNRVLQVRVRRAWILSQSPEAECVGRCMLCWPY